MSEPQIVWLRRDLRLCDQAAFTAAAARGPVIPVYILDDETPGERKMGGASRWWLHQALESLSRDLARHQSQLVLRRGDAVEELCKLAEETGARTVHALRHYEPWWRKAQGKLKERLNLQLHDGNYLLPPGSVTTGSGTPYKIFTPFKDAMFAAIDGYDILPEPSLTAPESWPGSDRLEDWNLLPTRPDWAGGMREAWADEHGTAAAMERFDQFLEVVSGYTDDRNLPSEDATSRLSPHLHFGEVSPRHVVGSSCAGTRTAARGCSAPSWSGATMRRTSPASSRATARKAIAMVMTKDCGAILPPARKSRETCRPGNRAAPAIPSSMPECASSGPPGGCTTGCG